MNFIDGIPEKFKTLVVIPSMFNSVSELEELLENLEVRFLANRSSNIHFALLDRFQRFEGRIFCLKEQDLLMAARTPGRKH